MDQMTIGVIGGSGLYEIEGLTDIVEVRLETPFGDPSDVYITGMLEGVKMVFLPRHGRGHRLLPSEVPYRANIYGMKKLGVQRIISVSAVGSMKEEIVPGHIVVPDQFFDRTQGKRESTFFGHGVAGHVQFADPVCSELSNVLVEAGQSVGATVHRGGTYVCIEGPNFSTRAESNIYRSWGVDIIGMTNIPEARLAREAEICYGTVAVVTLKCPVDRTVKDQCTEVELVCVTDFKVDTALRLRVDVHRRCRHVVNLERGGIPVEQITEVVRVGRGNIAACHDLATAQASDLVLDFDFVVINSDVEVCEGRGPDHTCCERVACFGLKFVAATICDDGRRRVACTRVSARNAQGRTVGLEVRVRAVSPVDAWVDSRLALEARLVLQEQFEQGWCAV